MTQSVYPREIKFDAVGNFRDLGGYRTLDGHTTAWRRIFRSANLGEMTANDLDRMSNEVGLRAVLDLRGKSEVEKQGKGLLPVSKIAYYNVTLGSDDRGGPPHEEAYKDINNMGEFYFNMTRKEEVGKRMVKAFNVLSEPANHPLLFHCYAGKDRTGMLAAFLLSILNVSDEDICKDYALSTPYAEILRNRMKDETKTDEKPVKIPDFFWQATPDLIGIFLNAIRREYGSPREYLQKHGAEPSLFDRLGKILLV
jgi:protein-tyrosine phosphatase